MAAALVASVPSRVAAAPSAAAAELQALQQADQRVADVGWKLLANNTRLCPKRSNALGITLHNLPQYQPEVRDAAREAFGFSGDLPSVLSVAEGSPAARAGVKPNDALVRIDNVDLAQAAPQGPADGKAASYASIDRAMRLLEALPDGQQAKLTVLRAGKELSFTALPQAVCRSRIELAPGGAINANANGDVAQISGGLAAMLVSNDELALVLGHEIAHNQLGHPQRIANEKLMSGLLPGLGRKGRELRDMERTADRFGMLMAANAGFNYRIAPSFWEHFTQRSGLGSIWATTHPNARNRRQNLEAVIAEIDEGKPSPEGLANPNPNETGRRPE